MLPDDDHHRCHWKTKNPADWQQRWTRNAPARKGFCLEVMMNYIAEVGIWLMGMNNSGHLISSANQLFAVSIGPWLLILLTKSPFNFFDIEQRQRYEGKKEGRK